MSPSMLDLGTHDVALRSAVAKVRRHRRRRLLLEGVAATVAAALVALLLGAVLRTLMGPGDDTVLAVRLSGYVLIAAVAARYLVWPLLGRISDARLALYVEERAPHLRQTLMSAVHEMERPVAERSSPALAARVIDQAVAAVDELEQGAALERPRSRRAGAVLAGAGTLGLLLALAGPGVIREAGRLLFVPWTASASEPVFRVLVEPGDITVPRGAALDLRADLRGFTAAEAQIVFRNDSATEWVRLPLQRDSTGSGFTGRLFDLVAPMTYFIEAEGMRSPEFAIAVVDLPAVSNVALELRFPRYTGLPLEKIEDGGDVAAVRGTTVRVRGKVTMPVQGGTLRFDDGTTRPLMVDSTGNVVGDFVVTRDGFYRIDLTAPDGVVVPGTVQYAITALEDREPSVRIETPGRDIKVTATEEVAIAVRAADDFGVMRLELRYRVNGGEERRIPLADSLVRSGLDLRAVHTLFLEEVTLEPGDLIAYHALARDGAGQTASSDIYFLEIRPFGLNYRAGEEGEAGGGEGGEGGEGGNATPDELAARQKQVVAGTFNWLRDSAKTAPRIRRENLTTLAIEQGKLREDVAGLAARIAGRQLAEEDSAFVTVKAELDSAHRHMKDAEEALGLGRSAVAITSAQRALQHVQRAQAVYRDIEIRRQQDGGGGGGGGGGQQQEDLADLFELDTDKLQNQYEAVQQQRSQTAQREVDEAAERLRQLASRQQQENERAQRAMQALQQRLGQSGSGASGSGGAAGAAGGAGVAGGGSAQRELARQAEEEARRLERLSRERNSPQLADAARRTQEAADAMRRASTGATGQGNAALDRLRNATRNTDDARRDGLTDDIRRLDDRARALEQEQSEIARGVAGLPAAAPTERATQLRALDQRKDAMGRAVEQLQGEAERLARDARRDQPRAAQALEGASSTIREGRLPDRIDYSKRVMRAGSPEYVRAFEQQIGEQVEAVRERLSSAAGAVGESDAVRQERALDRTRDLVRGMESLRDRVAQQPREGQGQGQGQGEGTQTRGSGQGGGRGAGSADAGSPRQRGREVALRRGEAEAIRREVAAQGGELGELDRAITELRSLEEQIARERPQGVAELQASIIEGLKTFEFTLWRQLNGGEGRPALGARGQVPAEYRAMVEEYYRALARRP